MQNFNIDIMQIFPQELLILHVCSHCSFTSAPVPSRQIPSLWKLLIYLNLDPDEGRDWPGHLRKQIFIDKLIVKVTYINCGILLFQMSI